MHACTCAYLGRGAAQGRRSAAPPEYTRAMVRVFCIRHAESVENVAMTGVMQQIATRQLSSAVMAHAMDKAMDEATPPNGDAPLTEKGFDEAQQLGEYWAPLLHQKAQEGKLLAFVSPQIRCMATADAVLQRLDPSVQAQVLPDMIEVPGMMNRDDREAFFGCMLPHSPRAPLHGHCARLELRALTARLSFSALTSPLCWRERRKTRPASAQASSGLRAVTP